jgi:hypothetical protein
MFCNLIARHACKACSLNQTCARTRDLLALLQSNQQLAADIQSILAKSPRAATPHVTMYLAAALGLAPSEAARLLATGNTSEDQAGAPSQVRRHNTQDLLGFVDAARPQDEYTSTHIEMFGDWLASHSAAQVQKALNSLDEQMPRNMANLLEQDWFVPMLAEKFASLSRTERAQTLRGLRNEALAEAVNEETQELVNRPSPAVPQTSPAQPTQDAVQLSATQATGFKYVLGVANTPVQIRDLFVPNDHMVNDSTTNAIGFNRAKLCAQAQQALDRLEAKWGTQNTREFFKIFFHGNARGEAGGFGVLRYVRDTLNRKDYLVQDAVDMMQVIQNRPTMMVHDIVDHWAAFDGARFPYGTSTFGEALGAGYLAISNDKLEEFPTTRMATQLASQPGSDIRLQLQTLLSYFSQPRIFRLLHHGQWQPTLVRFALDVANPRVASGSAQRAYEGAIERGLFATLPSQAQEKLRRQFLDASNPTSLLSIQNTVQRLNLDNDQTAQALAFWSDQASATRVDALMPLMPHPEHGTTAVLRHVCLVAVLEMQARLSRRSFVQDLSYLERNKSDLPPWNQALSGFGLGHLDLTAALSLYDTQRGFLPH